MQGCLRHSWPHRLDISFYWQDLSRFQSGDSHQTRQPPHVFAYWETTTGCRSNAQNFWQKPVPGTRATLKVCYWVICKSYRQVCAISATWDIFLGVSRIAEKFSMDASSSPALASLSQVKGVERFSRRPGHAEQGLGLGSTPFPFDRTRQRECESNQAVPEPTPAASGSAEAPGAWLSWDRLENSQGEWISGFTAEKWA